MIDPETNGHEPGLGRLVQRLTTTTVGALHNRFELLIVELEEEKGRLLKAVLIGVGLLFLQLFLRGGDAIIQVFDAALLNPHVLGRGVQPPLRFLP